MNVELKDFFGILLSAFAGSLAAVIVTFRIEASRSRSQARTDLILAISNHCERLGEYAAAFWEAEAFARTKFQGTVIPGAPEKPSIRILDAQLLAAGGSMGGDAKIALQQIRERVRAAAVDQPESREEIADWKTEADRLQDLAAHISQWDGRKPALPTLAELGAAPRQW